MKIRNGFVSNSSSSSFIIKTDNRFKTIYDVSKFIMNDMMSQWSNDDIDYSEELRTLEQLKDKNTPVFFDSYDGSYIRKFKDYIIVSSTQHYNYYKINSEIVDFKNIVEDYFKELSYIDEDYPEDGVHEIKSQENFNYYWKKFNDFLILKSGFYGVWGYDYKNDCDCGSKSILKLKNGETLCKCKATKKYNRSLKLKNIKNENP